MHKFGIGTYKTRDGNDATVVSDQVPGRQPLCGWIVSPGGTVTLHTWNKEGRHRFNGSNDFLDLMPPKPWTFKLVGMPTQFEVYLNGEAEFYAECSPEAIASVVNLLNAAEDKA